MWSCLKPVRLVSAYREPVEYGLKRHFASIFGDAPDARRRSRAKPVRYAAATPVPPVITHSIQRHGDPLPTIDPRYDAGGTEELKLAADAPAIHPNQPSPQEREVPSEETMAPAPQEPKAPAPATQEPTAAEPAAQPSAEEPAEAAEKPAESQTSEQPSEPAQPAEPEEPAEPEQSGEAQQPSETPSEASAPAEPQPEPTPTVLPRLSSPPFAAPSPEDRAAISQCRSEEAGAGRAASACIGRVADSCAEKLDGDAAATNACVERETRVWAEKLDESLGLLKARLSEEKAEELADVQESWVDFRQRNCAFYSNFYSGPLTLAQAGYCIMRETARRSIEVDSLLTQAEQR